MAIDTHWLSFGDGFTGFAARPPSAAPLPVVVVIQEAWGVNAHIEDVTRRFAKAGYFAFAPDLFSRNGARPPALAKERMAELLDFVNAQPPGSWMDPQAREAALSTRPKEEAARIGESLAAMMGRVTNLAQHLPVLLAATAFLRAQPATKGQKVGSVGFCLGGGCSALLACSDPQLSAAAVFYGSAPPAEQVANLACPVIGFYGANDARINEGISGFSSAAQQHGKSYEPYVLPGAGHAFFNDTRPSYHAPSVRESWARLLDFYRRTLS
jgi:carboxymethylenebutenolidase